ncbi:hypothetical protein NQ315_007544 [Exocentrus adspersus]|uniref:Uncharacterized protein n=1 Tax=Exocentrus adspersus TaxID=1586481 RepID=A0AAV8W824_9CUCU|nr:hypothetical protein NQ315_007544 [Exocentrus adspersus]
MIALALFFCMALVAVQAGHFGVGFVGPSEHGTVIQGPGSKASVLGPDGSHISAAVGGGTVVAPPKAGGVVSAAVAPGYVAPAAPVHFHSGVAAASLGLFGLPGSGHEGQYVPDYTEQLYDDGSYKGDYYGGHEY